MRLLRTILIWFLFLIPYISTSGYVLQNFTATTGVSLMMKFFDDNNRPLFGSTQTPINVNLLPSNVHSAVIPLAKFVRNLKYTIVGTNTTTEKIILSNIERTMKLQNGMEWIEDIISNGNTQIKIQSIYKCNDGYSGPMCEKQCDMTTLKSGRKRCDELGRTRCDYGWMGSHCSQAIDPRKCSCQNNGICASSINFDTNDMFDRLICECPSGFVGDKCEMAIGSNNIIPKSSICDIKDTCLNGAECFPNGPTAYCSCPNGFVGEFCEIQVDNDYLSSSSNQEWNYYNLAIMGISIISIFVILCVAFFTYKYKPQRKDALTRLQLPTYNIPNAICTKSMLLNKNVTTKIYTINKPDDIYERYTSAPINNSGNDVEYAIVTKQQQLPPPPSHLPPPTPI